MPLFSTFCKYFGRFLNAFYTLIERFARILIKLHISANMLTFLGLGFALFGLNFAAMESYFLTFVCLIINRLCDVLDGAVARKTAVKPFGIFLDMFADITAAALFIWGFILGNIFENAAAGSFYLVAFMIASTALLSFSIISKQDYAALNQSGLKICYLGAFQNADIFTALTLMCLLPFWFMPIAIFFGLLLIGKTLLIISGAYQTLVIAKRTNA